MTEYGATWEREDLGGGAFRLTQHLRPIAYFEDGAYRPMVNDFANDGSGAHIVTASPLMVTVGDDANGRATRRIHPTRELDVWAEIGRPYNVTTREPYPLNAFTRSGNQLTSTNTLADVHIWHGGHFSKLGIRLKGTWRTAPPAQFAFPVALNGLTWSAGGVLRKDGVPVMHLTAPVVYDFNNPDDVRKIDWEFTTLGGQTYVVFTLPTNMASSPMQVPIVDPTLELQPNAAAGQDTFIQETSPTNNFGTNVELLAGQGTAANRRRRFQLLFDFTSIPSGAGISSAEITLFCTSESTTTDYAVGLHRALTQWFEGTKNGAAPGAGEDGSTWNLRNANGSVAWAGGAGGGSGSDYVAIASDSETITGTGTAFIWSVISDVQGFVNGSLTNLGWWGINANEIADSIKRFASSDDTTAANRPKVAIVYTESNVPAAMAYYRRLRG